MYNQFRFDVETMLGILLDEKQLELFQKYYDFLISYNEITNLTRITDEKEVYYKHFFDSITILNTIDIKKVNSICDMGAGAGFPSIPIKIINPNLKITIVDSLGKRITFLQQLMDKLELTDVTIVHDRAENYALKHQLEFDLVTARALGDLSLICEMGLPMTKVNGIFLAYKGKNYLEELKTAQNAIITLGGELIKVNNLELPYEMGYRSHIVIKKVKKTYGFPRSYVLMRKKPL